MALQKADPSRYSDPSAGGAPVQAVRPISLGGGPRRVIHPGSRGSTHHWRDTAGHDRYDPHPEGRPAEGPEVDALPPVGGVGPEGENHLGLLRPLSTGSGQDDPRASVAALAANSAHDPVRMGTTPRLWRETVLNRQGIAHPGRRGAPPVLGGEARSMSAAVQDTEYDPERHDPPASRDANAPMRTAYFPSTAAKWATDGGASVRSLIDNMNPQVKDEAIRGLQHAENNHRLAQRHALSARSVLMHFCWSTLSKSAAPYTQEAGYMDMEKSGLGYFVDKALRGEFDKGEYQSWLGDNGDNIIPKGTWLGARKATANVAAREKQLSGVPSAEERGYLIRPADGSPEMASWEKAHPHLAGQIREKKFKGLGDGSPGGVVGYNMRSLGDVLDHWSQPADPQDTGGQAISKAQHLANIVSDPKVSGREARRKIWESGLLGKIGMQNKVLSFSLGMLGKTDVGVLDIWQARRFLPEAFRHEVKQEMARREAAVPEDEIKAAQEKAATEATLHVQGLGEKRHALDLARQAHRDASDRLVGAGSADPAERKAAMRAVAQSERAVAKAETDLRKHSDKTNDIMGKLEKVGDKFKVSPDDVISNASANVCHAFNNGPAGLANYEAWEDMLQQGVNHGLDPAKLVTRDGKHRAKPSNFALHWLSWVGGFDAAVGHRSLDALQAMDNQGLMLRPQNRDEGPGLPTTEDRLLRMAQTEVQQGTPAARDYLSVYRRGHIHPNELHKQVWNVPTELIPGSGSSAFGDWIKQQDHDTRARFTEEGSRALEPTMRKIAADHGLAMSQDESFGGFAGAGNANSYALLAPLHHDMPWEHQHAAVRGFAGTLGKALKQDAAVYQKVARSYARNKDEENDIHRGYDFRLNRKPTPEEANRIAHHVSQEMLTDEERAAGKEAPASDTGYTLLPNNTARFVDFEKTHPDYMDRVARGIWKAGGDNPLHAVGPDGKWDVRHVPVRGGYLGNDWEGKPGGDDYSEWIDAADQARQLYGRRTGGDGGRGLADRLRAEYEAHCADFYRRHHEAKQQQLHGEDPDLVAKSWGGDEDAKTGGDEQPTDYGDLGPWRPEAAGQRIAKLIQRSPALAGVMAQAAKVAPEAHDDPQALEQALASAARSVLGKLDESSRQQLIRSLSEVIRVVQWDMLHRHGGSILGARGGDRDGNDPRQGWHGEGPTGRERPRSFHHVAHDDTDLPTDPKHDGRHFVSERDPEKVLWSDHLASGALGDDQYAPAQKQMIAHGRPQRTWEYDKETQGRRLIKADDGGVQMAHVPHDSQRQPWEGVAHEAFGHGIPARHAATLGALAHHAAAAGAGRGLPVAQRSPFANAPELRPKHGPQLNPFIHEEANRYVQHHGIAPSVEDHGYAPHDPATAQRIADAYDQMPHAPHDPATQRSYAALKDEIGQQWHWATKNMGIKFEPWEKEGEPYANSAAMRQDVGNHRHLYFFQGGQMPADHPLAEVDPQSGFSANDKFRAIHDLYGHAQGGYEFGPRGEENAWIAHSRMFSDAARPALTSETRGQNSWVNFGAHLRRPDGTLPAKGEQGYVPAAQRPFAEQRAGLLPEEFWGGGAPVGKSLAKARTAGLTLRAPRKGGGPGSRGGKYWRDGKNHVRYDERPEAHADRSVGSNPDQVATKTLDAAAWTAYSKGMANRRLTPRTAEIFREIAQREGGTEDGVVEGVLADPDGKRYGSWRLRDGWRGGTYFEVDTSDEFKRNPLKTVWSSLKQAAKGALVDPFRPAEKSATVEGSERDNWHAGSKVVHPDGSPKVLYHGSGALFDQFKVGGPDGKGVASVGRGVNLVDSEHEARKWAYMAGRSPGATPTVYGVHVNLKNPLKITQPDRPELPEDRRYMSGQALTDYAQEHGHDGIHWDYSGTARSGGRGALPDEYIAFHPHQIRIAHRYQDPSIDYFGKDDQDRTARHGVQKSGWRTGLTKPRHGGTLLLWVDTPSQEGADMVATLEPTTELTKSPGGDQWRGEARDDSGKWTALRGSDKQIKWANDIRAKKLAEVPAGPERDHLATNEADSRFWIDRRDRSADQLKYDARGKLPKAVQDKIAAAERAASGATEKTTYDIAASRLPWLDQQFAKIAAKAKRLKLTPPSYEIVGSVTKQVADPDGLDPDATKPMVFHTVKVKGEAPKINGWVFLGKVEHGEEGNVLSAVPGKSIPAQFRTGGQMCDHCHATRKRTDTFIVQNEKTGEVKQIGRNCLSDFLGGANPEALASQAEWLGDAAGILGAAEGEEGFGGGARKREAYPIDHFLPYVAAVIKRDGWVSKTKATETGQQATVISAENEYRDKDKKRDHRDRSEPLVLTADDEKTATDALAWARKKVDVPDAETALDDYWWNIAQVVGKSTVDPRRIGLLGSIIPAYQRETGEQRQKKAVTDGATGGKEVGKEWLGEVGGKLPATVVTVLNVIPIPSDYGTFDRYKLVDTDGHLIMWDRRQSGPEMAKDKSYRITAKINDHREWKGDKETRVTNVKAVPSAREKALLVEAQRLETERELARQRYDAAHKTAYAAAADRIRAENPQDTSYGLIGSVLGHGDWRTVEDNRDNDEFFVKHPEFAPVRKLLLAKDKAEGALNEQHFNLLRDGYSGEVTPDDDKVPASAKKATAKAEAAAATVPAKPKIDRATSAARKAKLASLTEAVTAAEGAVKAADIAHRNAANVTYAEQKRVAARDGVQWSHTVTVQTHPEMAPHERAQRAARVAEHNATIARDAALARVALHKAQVALADLGPHSSAKDHLLAANAMREAALALREHETATHSGEGGENPSGWRSHLLRLRHEALDTYTNSLGGWGSGLGVRLEALAKAEKQGIPVPAKELAEIRAAIAAVPELPSGSVDKKYTSTLAKLTKDHDTKKAAYEARNAESSKTTRDLVDLGRKMRFGGKYTPEEQALADRLEARDKELSAQYDGHRKAYFDASGALNKHEQDGWTKGGGESFWKLLEG